MYTQHFIEIFVPGIPGTEILPVTSRKREDAALPLGALAYRFFDRDVINLDQARYAGERKDQGPLNYIGTIVTVEQVKRLPGDHSEVLASLHANGLQEAVLTPCERVYVLRPGELVVSA